MNRGDNNLPHRDRNPRSVVVPARRNSPAPAPKVDPKPAQPPKPKNLAQVREDLGFDDIPIDALDSRSMRDVLNTWITQAFRVKHPDNKAGRMYRFFRHKKFQSWKDDLKWALQADMLDESEHKKTPPKAPVQPPAPPSSVHRVAAQPQSQSHPLHPAASHASATKSVEININFGSMPKLPAIKKPTALKSITTKARSFQWTRTRIIAAVAIVIVATGAIAWRTIPGLPGSNKTTPGAITSTSMDQKPEYGTLVPSDKSIESLGGWHRVSPPGKDAVFAYADKIDGVQVNVSQQPLPKTFKPDVDKHITELAKGYSATHKIESDSQTIYVGTSAQGPQSVILAKDDLLILMKSVSKIDDKAWAAYVESLK